MDLRNIKTTLGLKTLDCKTARMNEKQWWVGMLAYNLIRLLMLGSAKLADVLPRQISFNTPYSYGWHGVRADRPMLRTSNRCLLLWPSNVSAKGPDESNPEPSSDDPTHSLC